MTRYCSQCGQSVPNTCKYCTKCGAPIGGGSQPQYQFNFGTTPQQQPVGPKPNNYMVWSILVTIFCCLPLGIWCVACSKKVNQAWDNGDFAGAQNESDKTKKWIIISAILGLIANVSYILSSGVLDQL